MIVEFKVSGMHCESCLKIIKMNVEELAGVSEVSGDNKGKVIVSFDEKLANLNEIKKKIEQDGYKVVGQKVEGAKK